MRVGFILFDDSEWTYGESDSIGHGERSPQVVCELTGTQRIADFSAGSSCHEECTAIAPEYHGEGDVLPHALLALHAVDDDDDERVFWAVLLHDLGKSKVTRLEDGRWRAHAHTEAGCESVPCGSG